MSDEETNAGTEGQTSDDSTVDAVAAVALVLIAVAFAVYWVANQ